MIRPIDHEDEGRGVYDTAPGVCGEAMGVWDMSTASHEVTSQHRAARAGAILLDEKKKGTKQMQDEPWAV